MSSPGFVPGEDLCFVHAVPNSPIMIVITNNYG